MTGRGAEECARCSGEGGLRIALYSHDTLGIGHLRRNLRIARSLATAARPAGILLIAGAREVGCFSMPDGVDCLTLPSFRKDDEGRYTSRVLGVSLDELVRLRSASMAAALNAFAPDVIIVDKVPRGALGELDGTLESLRAHHGTQCVLGLRDVLDDPEAVRREWELQRTGQALRDCYDAVWVYGDPRVYDPVSEYGLDVEACPPVRFAGYLNPCGERRPGSAAIDEPVPDLGLPPGRLALCVVGGGQDGAALASAFCDANLPADMNGLIVTGPFMPKNLQDRIRRAAADRPRLRVLEFVADPEALMRSADRIIAMGGYNTVCEILALGKQALIVPRVRPRREQLIRAERLRGLNLVDLLLPCELSPAALSGWLSRQLPARPAARDHIDFTGLERLPAYLADVMASRADSPTTTRKQQEICLVTS